MRQGNRVNEKAERRFSFTSPFQGEIPTLPCTQGGASLALGYFRRVPTGRKVH